MIAELVGLGCGCWEDVAQQFTFSRYRAMWRYWTDHPPVQMMVAAYMGVKPRERESGDLGELLSMFGGDGISL